MSPPSLSPLPAAVLGSPPEFQPEQEAPWSPGKLAGQTWEKANGLVDSVQWVDLPRCPNWDLAQLERAYFAWVPRVAAQMVQPVYDAEGLRLGIEPWWWPHLIRMAPAEEGPEARRRPILGGLLARASGAISFELLPVQDLGREVEGRRLIVALRDFDPRLPRWLYFRVQTRMHERSTFAFLRQAARLSG